MASTFDLVELRGIILKNGSGWQKRLFFANASASDLKRLSWMSNRLAENGAEPAEILELAREMSRKHGWQEVAR